MGILKKRFYDARIKDVLQTAAFAEWSTKWALNGQSSIDDNGCMEGLTEKLHSVSEFTNETYVEIKNDNKLASM